MSEAIFSYNLTKEKDLSQSTNLYNWIESEIEWPMKDRVLCRSYKDHVPLSLTQHSNWAKYLRNLEDQIL